MSELNFLYLSQEDVIKCGGLDMRATLHDVKTATVMAYQGNAIEATTASLFWDLPKENLQRKIGYPGKKRINIHSACLDGEVKAVGIKNIPSCPDNPKKLNSPRTSGFITLVDFDSGYPYALMDASIISGFRTGALAGMGAEFLSNSKASVVGLIGTGPINKAALIAVKESVPTISTVKLFDIALERSLAFKDYFSNEFGLNIEIVDSAKEAVADTDIVMPATNVTIPEDAYIKYSWIKPGCLLIDLSLWDEEVEVFQKADKLVVNSSLGLQRINITPGCLIEQGFFTKNDFFDLGSIIKGESKARENDSEIIVYFARGMAIYDVINAYRVYQIAKKQGVGKELSLWSNPYWF